MAYRITARLNTRTGEFEVFQVDALDNDQPAARHNADHEETATALGRLVERRPVIDEVNEAGLPNLASAPRRARAPEEQEAPAGRPVRDQESL
jgi:hypothetical protein